MDSFRVLGEIYAVPPAEFRRTVDELIHLLDMRTAGTATVRGDNSILEGNGKITGFRQLRTEKLSPLHEVPVTTLADGFAITFGGYAHYEVKLATL